MATSLVQKPISQLSLSPGSVVTIADINWQELEQILAEFGDKRSVRIAYNQGVLEVMVPLPEHEKHAVIIGDIVKLILKLQGREWECLRSTTYKNELKRVGIEPDDSFYIENYQAVIGKNRLDLSIDPPPDLAIKIDLTSRTQESAYLALRVPELWIYTHNTLRIFCLENDRYRESQESLIFPGLNLTTLIPDTIKNANTKGISVALRELEIYFSG
jgi:Uma2 family endonuclease